MSSVLIELTPKIIRDVQAYLSCLETMNLLLLWIRSGPCFLNKTSAVAIFCPSSLAVFETLPLLRWRPCCLRALQMPYWNLFQRYRPSCDDHGRLELLVCFWAWFAWFAWLVRVLGGHGNIVAAWPSAVVLWPHSESLLLGPAVDARRLGG